VQTNVFGPACRCHWGLDREANLELYAPGLEARLIGRPSTQCDNMTLIVPGDPDGSYLVRKLMDAAPACGNQMPGGTLPDDKLQAVRAWVAALDRAPASR